MWLAADVVVDWKMVIAFAVVIVAVAIAWKARKVEVHVGSIKGNAEFAAEQLSPNGGTSLRDAVDRIERNQASERQQRKADTARLDRKLDGLNTRLTDIEEVVTKP